MPAQLEREQTARIRQLAIDAVRALDCEGMARVDFLFETASGQFYVNEVNTLPGFTSISMYPKMWEHSGIAYSDLLTRLIDLALARHARRKATQFRR